MNLEEFEREIATEFSGMTVEQVLELARFGKEVLSISDDLAGDLMLVTERVLKSDESLVHDIQYCLASLPALAKHVYEHKYLTK